MANQSQLMGHGRSAVLIREDRNRRNETKATLEEQLALAVTAFGDPRQAISHIKHEAPGLIITDLDLTFINGAELVGRTREAVGVVPAIILTDVVEAPWIERALGGPTACLPPEIETEALVAVARSLLRMVRPSGPLIRP